MKIARTLLLVALAVIVNALITWLNNLPQDAGVDVPDGKVNSVSFAPFREDHSPLTLVFPNSQEIDEDLRLLAGQTHTIRTYASSKGLTGVPAIARKYGLKMIQGAWIGGPTVAKENEEEITALIKAANDYPDVITRVIVGNEVLLRGELEPEQLLSYIRRVKQAVRQPVSYADVWSFYMRYPEIAKEVDFFTVHILPYWEDEPLPVDKTAEHIVKNYQRIREAYSGKPILIGESGWPSAGRQRGWAVPSVVNEAKFIRSLVQVANKHGFDINIVEAFNQPWKSKLEGVVGANWGLYSVDRKLVFPLTGKVVENPEWPKRVLFAGLLTLVAVGFYAKRLAALSALPLLAFVGFAHLLSALQVNQTADLWYTSYNNMERFHALSIAALGIALGALLLQRGAELLRCAERCACVPVWSRYLFLTFVALAFYKAQALGLNGRYLNIPYPLIYIPVIGVLGLLALGAIGGERNWRLVLAEMLGGTENSRFRACRLSAWAALAGAALLVFEVHLTMTGTNFPTAYPIFADRLYAAFITLLTYSQMQGWVLLIAAVIFLLPPRFLAGALILAVPALIVGETYAFMIGHDFIEAHPDFGDRLQTALLYTVTNCQMLRWLGSLGVMALPLWAAGRRQNVSAPVAVSVPLP
ncbi:exo-beta-1,3-glucanase [Methylomicrobium album]|uniref:Endo-1,3-beta-glucanase btgC n=1 Tax=Methylomicrobium album BG8 TaxID=686340 RepID=H8GJY6_METAL|nr:exo-beta-1,3-glucanase [Methylomicrobium album]EIC27945.1 exo-beta-1,3-glucanase [Methylomicrobium album BG8]